jgi:hypothetical protein
MDLIIAKFVVNDHFGYCPKKYFKKMEFFLFFDLYRIDVLIIKDVARNEKFRQYTLKNKLGKW